MARISLTSAQKISAEEKQIQKRLKACMALADISQKDVADYLGLTQPAVSYQLTDGRPSLALVLAVRELTNHEVLR